MAKILVVDDEYSIRATLCEFLKQQGHEVTPAADAVSALDLIREGSFDVIVSDIIMPRLSGIALLEKIRGLDSEAQVIIMTGEPTVDTAISAVQSGANDYLVKPIKRDDFLKAVNHVLSIKHLQDEKKSLEEQNRQYQHGLEKIVENRTGELRRNMEGIVFLLSSVTEVRDPYTAGHQRRVGNLSAAIGRALGFSEKEAEFLRVTGYMHDIGKIMIPTEILAKPEPLNPIEKQIVRGHPEHAFEMLQQVNLPKQMARAIYQHHERYDGSGYPFGLLRNELCMEAQILSVADVLEAMTSHRPYRAAQDLSAALAEIEHFAGTSYHPEVSAVCLRLFREEQYQIDESVHDISFSL